MRTSPRAAARVLQQPRPQLLALALLLLALSALLFASGCANAVRTEAPNGTQDLATAGGPVIPDPADDLATAPSALDLGAQDLSTSPSPSPSPSPSSPTTPTTPTPTPNPTPTPTAASIAGCPVFPADHAWNQDISSAPVHASSASFVGSIGAQTALHPDWSSTAQNPPYGYGIPYVVVPGTQPKVAIAFGAYAAESDPGPYPIPSTVPIEGGATSTGDRHAIVLDSGSCYAYEMLGLTQGASGWQADVGAVWHLRESWTRPARWTSADAAGLAVLPGLVRYDEVAAGAINHALRFTVSHSQRGYVAPASHFASSSTDATLPPMGLRLRLKASIDETRFPTRMRVILRALKRYGMIVADNGGDWFVQGAPDSRWDDSEIATLKQLKGSDFEAVETGPILH